MTVSLSASDSSIINRLFAEATRAAGELGAAGAWTVVGAWARASTTEGGVARAGTGAATTGVDGAAVPRSVEKVGAAPSTAVGAGAGDESGAGTELLQLALSNSESVLHRWPRTLSLSALRKDVGSNGRCSRQNSL
jgi:hypothetical protein